MKLQSNITLTLLFIVLTTFAFAGRPIFGLKAGVNFANVDGDYLGVEVQTKVGYHIGFTLDNPVSQMISIAPEFLYSSKGTQQLATATVMDGPNIITEKLDYTITLNYFQVPVLIKVNFESGLHLDAGPYIGILTSARYEGMLSHSESADPSAYQVGTFSVSSTEGLAAVDAGLVFAFGYQFREGIGFGVRYELGLTDINDPPNRTMYSNSVLGISLNYLFYRK